MAQWYDFAGQRIILPGAYTKRFFPKDQGSGSTAGKVLILGEASKGGVPYDAYTDVESVINVITGQAQALNVFGGGDLYYGAEFFLTPTKDSRFNTPSQANCIVVNKMTQAGTTIVNSSTTVLDLLYGKFGTDGNQAAIKISAGTTTGKLLQLLYKGTEVLNTDNVTLPLFSIQYTGAGSACTLTITATTLSTTVTAGGSTDTLSITLADYDDLGSLINYINSNSAYTCTLTGKSDEFANVFDAVTAVDIKTASYDAVGIVESLLRAINASESFTATLHTGSARLIPDNLSAYKFLTGGTVTAATTDDWTKTLTKLEKYDFDCIVPMSGSTTIQNLVTAHVEKMNGVKVKKYRQAITGSGSATSTKALRISQIKSLNSAYTEYAVSPFKRYDYVNKQVPTTNFDSYYLAPLVAGLRYSNNIGMDVVFKYLNVLSTPEITKEDQEAYAEAGAVFIQKTTNVLDSTQNFEILCDNSTYQGSQVTRTNPACVYEINKLTKDFEERVTEKIRALDEVANSVIMSSIENWVTTYLFPYYRDSKKWITNYTDASGNVQKAFDNVSFEQDGEQLKITATLTMSVTPRFVFNFLTFIVPGQNV
jgi:hypothetical protein